MEKRRLAGIGFLAGRWPLHPAKPTIVFIHGAGFTDVLWRRQVAALGDQANCIALDLPGHGASEGPGRERIADYAESVYGFVHGIAAPRPFLCGHSMGGAVALRLAIDHGDRFAGVALLNTGARLRVAPEILEAITRDYDAYVASLPDFAASPNTRRSMLEPLLREACGHEDPAVVAGDFRACDAFDVMGELWRVQVPTLAVAGEDDQVTPPKFSRYLAEHIAGAELQSIAHAGHLAPLEQPDAVTGVISRFLLAQA